MTHGIEFDETMAGAFALDETDPERGREKGQVEGTRLAMHASVAIADLDAFIADPAHLGGLTGRIDFEPLGTDLEASAGAFNLFSPSDDPELKLMVYELAFEAQRQPYYVAGRKEVRDDRGFDLWSDTTTLYTRLHRGRDDSGPVIGAGVLTLGVRELTDLLSTLRVTGAGSPADTVKVLARFGGFFMGELWDTYGPEVARRLAPGHDER